jgi:hypothetical protein
MYTSYISMVLEIELNKTNLEEEWKEGIGVPLLKVVRCNYIENVA